MSETNTPLRIWALLLLLTIGATTGCGRFMAHRIAQAPNSYPTWLAPKARVLIEFSDSLLTNLPAQFVEVGPPQARLRYRVVPPADYQLQMDSTNRMDHGQPVFHFTLRAKAPGQTNAWTAAPRGTVVLLHGYGLAEFTMIPWALRLAEEGWRCVTLDLRGHGRSTGKRIYYGTRETTDVSQLLDFLEQDGQLARPVAVVGESYGAALALRWKTIEPRVGPVVAIAPYAVLSNAVLNISREYAPCFPRALPRAGMKRLPSVLGVAPGELDPVTVLEQNPIKALMVAADEDRITSSSDMKRLFDAAAPGSELIIVPDATHETVTFHFDELIPPVLKWLSAAPNSS